MSALWAWLGEGGDSPASLCIAWVQLIQLAIDLAIPEGMKDSVDLDNGEQNITP